MVLYVIVKMIIIIEIGLCHIIPFAYVIRVEDRFLVILMKGDMKWKQGI